MRFADAVAELDRRTNYERSGRLTAPTLDRMAALMDMMDHPERNYPTLHVTGTNGKTTCARAATEVLRAAGLRVATYTSPHVESVRERFSYDGAPIPEEEFVDGWRELSPYLDYFDGKGMAITWFEAATALAFTWFADKAVDVAVVEVGMGGSWDATNVIDAGVAAITRVDLDHPELGATPAEVAREKAGIVKPGATLCTVAQDPAVEAVLRARCEEVGAAMRIEDEAFALERAALALAGQQLSIRLGDDRYLEVFLPVFGEHFARDAVLGAAAARAVLGDVALGEPVLTEAFSSIRIPGRMEIARRAPLVVLDGAHNPAAATALARTLPSSLRWERLWLVVSIMEDKDVSGVLAPLVPVADEVIVTRNDSPRAASTERLQAEVNALGRTAMSVANVADATAVALERAADGDCIVVTGSLYTVAEARRTLAPGPDHPTFPKENR